MRNYKKWLASILAIAIALGDCGGMTALATENAMKEETSVSDNTIISDESSTEEETFTDMETQTPEEETKKDETDQNLYGSTAEDAASEGTDSLTDTSVSKTDSELTLQAIRIGQIPEGETLPDADDDTFIYDLPISFETPENLILFASYDIELPPEIEETGTLAWSILRGEKGLETGSTSLLDEEDDWDGFETVHTSPFFTMEEITDRDSDYYQMMLLVSEESADPDESDENSKDSENYDYYIRAAFYPKTENGKADAFYTAATIPFAPKNDADQMTEDDGDTDQISDESADTEDFSSVSENSTDTDSSLSESVSGNDLTADSGSAEEETDSENADAENGETDQDAAPVSTLSENSTMALESAPAAETDLPPLEEESNIELILYQGSETDEVNKINEKKRIPLSPKDTLLITAKAVPDTALSNIVWESSDEAVATVTAGENGTATVTAAAEGYARITASLNGKTASAIVDVVPDKGNPDTNKLVDLSGGIRIAGFEKESDDLVYSGQKITQNLRVYHENTLLKEKTDYTVSYKNNVNAAAWNSTKAPSVTIKLKGQYQGSVTLYYTIKPLDINNIDIYNTEKPAPEEGEDTGKNSPGYEQTVNYSKKLSIPAPVLTFGKKKLAAKKDFVCDYTILTTALAGKDYKSGDSYEPGKVYSYTVNGTGNFTGSFSMQLVVLKDKKLNFASASVKLNQKQYEYHGAPLTKADVGITEVKLGGQILDNTQYDYEVCASGLEGAYVMVSPTDAGRNAGYRGCKKVTLKLVGDRQIKDAVKDVNWKESIPFNQKTVDKNGGMFQAGTNLLAYKEGGKTDILVEGTDYTVKYSNAKKAGNVTATFTGKGRYKGSLRLKYAITPNANIRIIPGKNVVTKNGAYETAYQKGGAVPELILKDEDYTVLKNKTDYTIKYKDNKTPGTPMTCEITGKGNYKGYAKTVTLTVTTADISQCTITVSDKPFSDKPNKWQSAVTVKDVNGKKLTAGTDYDKTLTYDYKGEQSPPQNTTVTVTVKGLGCYEGSLDGQYRIFAKNISTLKIVIDPQEYTGEEITLFPQWSIHAYANNTDAKKKQNEIMTDCYDIVEYKNNIKSGTAKVTLRGKGEYGGTKTYSFKILKKNYLINHVKGIKLDKNSLSFPLAESDEEKRTLTATITSEMDKSIANPTVVWSSSNSSIVSIEEKPGNTLGYDDGKRTVSVSAVLVLHKEGSATITATSQDGNRKAQCKVTVIDAPLLRENGQTIKENIGSTYQLHMEFAPSQDQSKLKWESNNPTAVSVDQTGLLTMKKAGAAVIKAVYTSNKKTFTQQCYAVAIDPDEKAPEPETGALLVYEQQDGITDDTPYINKMLRNYEWGDTTHVREVTLYIPAGVYHIDATPGGKDSLGNDKFGGIILTTNQRLVMSPSALLVAIGNNQENTRVIWAFGRDNVKISGGQIIGERYTHKGSSGEWGHGIQISGCTNVTIENVDVSQCWGDGIYLGQYNGICSSDISIENCNVHDNRRNNLSITDASNVTVKGSSFNYAKGTDPQYGIDIEPNRGKTCSNVTISDCTFKGNAKGTIQILGQLNAHVKGVTIENCTGDKAPVQWSGFGGSVSGVIIKNNNKWG